MSFQLKIIIAVAVLVLVALGSIFFFTGGGEKDVRGFLEEGLAAARRGDEEAIVGMLSRDYQSGDEGYEEMAARIRTMFSDPRRENLEFAGEPSITVHEDQADVGITVRASLGPRELRRGDFRLILKKEEGGWKVTSVEELR